MWHRCIRSFASKDLIFLMNDLLNKARQGDDVAINEIVEKKQINPNKNI